MLTESEYDRLPGVLRRIVDADRRLAPVRKALCAPVVAIGILRGSRRDLDHRRALTVEAERLYGYRMAGAGPATA